MSIISRYIFRQALGAVLMILGSLTVVIWLAVALRQLEFMAAQGQTTTLFFQLTGLALPGLIAFIAPIALLIAVVHTLNRLNGDSELIVTTAGGASTWRLSIPLLTLAFFVTMAMAVTNHLFAPWANRALREIALDARADLITQVLQEGRFTSPEQKLTVHIRARAPDGTLLGLLVHDARDDKQSTTYLAETAHMVRQGTSVFLLMEKGHILRKQDAVDAADVVVFDRYAVDINRFEQKAESGIVIKPRERTTAELLDPDPNDPFWRDFPGRFRAELHDRFAGLLYPFAYVLLALAFIGHPQTTRQNRTLALVLAVGAGFGCRMLGFNATNQAVAQASAVPMMYGVPLLTMGLAAVAIAANMWPSLSMRRARRVGVGRARRAAPAQAAAMPGRR